MQSFSDFISKSFKFDNSVKTVYKASGGVTIENSASPNGSAMTGYTKINFPVTNGKGEVQITANGKPKDTNAKFEFEKIQGAEFTLSANSEPSVSLEANYSPLSNVGTKAEFVTDLENSKDLNTSINTKFGDWKATCDKSFCLNGGGLKDFNFKLDYKTKSVLGTVKTSKGRSVVTAGVAQQYCSGWYYGAQVQHNIKDSSTVVTVGSKHKLDDKTNGSFKADSAGVFSAALEQKFANPAVKVNVAAQFNLLGSNCCAAEKFGLGMTFGDF